MKNADHGPTLITASQGGNAGHGKLHFYRSCILNFLGLAFSVAPLLHNADTESKQQRDIDTKQNSTGPMT